MHWSESAYRDTNIMTSQFFDELELIVNESLHYGRKTRVFRRSHIAAVGRSGAVVEVRAALVLTLIAGLRRRWQRKNPQRKPHNWRRGWRREVCGGS